MTTPPRSRLRLVLPVATALAAAAPVSFSPARGFVPNEACADGTCCQEDKSLCFINGVRVENAFMLNGGGSCLGQAH